MPRISHKDTIARCGVSPTAKPLNESSVLGAIIAFLLIGILAGCDSMSPTENSPGPRFNVISGDTTCPSYWRHLYEYSNCRPLNDNEKNAIRDQFFGPNNTFRSEHPNCFEMGQVLQNMLDNEVYWVDPAQAQGMNYHHPQFGITLDGMNFYDLNGQDPFKHQRFKTVAHEVSHRLGLPHPGTDVPGPNTDDAAAYCTREVGATDPWNPGGSNGGGGGGGGGGG